MTTRYAAPLALLLFASCGSSGSSMNGIDVGVPLDRAPIGMDAPSPVVDSGPAGPPPLEPPPNGIQLTMDPFTIEPGQEATYCQTFAGMFPDDIDVIRFESQMVGGSHHLAVAGLEEGPAEPLSPCLTSEIFRGNAIGMVYASQQSVDDQAFPQGVGFNIARGTGVRFQAHYINQGREPIQARVTVNFHYGAPGEVTMRAGNLYFSNTSLEVPGQASKTETRTCVIEESINLLSTNLHMHVTGVKGGARILGLDGTNTDILSVDTWDEPAARNYPFPGQPVAMGDSIEWSCEYVNPTSETLVFGDSATRNEMCVLIGRFYPITDRNTVFCSE